MKLEKNIKFIGERIVGVLIFISSFALCWEGLLASGYEGVLYELLRLESSDILLLVFITLSTLQVYYFAFVGLVWIAEGKKGGMPFFDFKKILFEEDE